MVVPPSFLAVVAAQCAVQPPSTGDRGAGDRGCGVRGEEHGDARRALDGGKALVRLLREQHVADDLLARDAVGLGLAVDLRLDQRRIDIARADGVAGDALLGRLERGHLGQAEHAVLGGDIGRLERRADQAMRRGDVDDAAPFVRDHRAAAPAGWCGMPS